MHAFLSVYGKYILLYLLFVSVLAFLLMGLDKHYAKVRAWRIPEKVLFLAALAGGSVGSILGMQLFRHKTRHWYFRLGMPLILVAQVLLAAFLLTRP